MACRVPRIAQVIAGDETTGPGQRPPGPGARHARIRLLAKPSGLWRRGAQYPQVTTSADLDTLADGLGRRARHRGLPHGVGERFKIIGCRLLGRRERQPDDIPASRDGHPVDVGAAQVITVRLLIGSQRPEDCGGVPVDVGQRADRITFARWPGAAARTQRPTSLRLICVRPQRLTVSVGRAVMPSPRALAHNRVLAGATPSRCGLR
jgi:hypothetical protein